VPEDAVVGTAVVGAAVVGATVVGAAVVGAAPAGFVVVGATDLGVSTGGEVVAGAVGFTDPSPLVVEVASVVETPAARPTAVLLSSPRSPMRYEDPTAHAPSSPRPAARTAICRPRPVPAIAISLFVERRSKP
jgi:hypothetical protein